MEDVVTVRFVWSERRSDLQRIRNELKEIAEKEATYLYRLAWRMTKHGCKPESIVKVREEARALHMTGYPERLVDSETRWVYAFKI